MTSPRGVHISQAALAALVHQHRDRLVDTPAEELRDRARENARATVPGGQRGHEAIVAVPGTDAEGPYSDVGYDRHHPGFFLWWWEVGTRNHRAVPHLRPAASPRS